MIQLRPRPLPPETLLSEDVKKEKRRIAGIIEKNGAVKSGDFKRFWGKPNVRKILWRHHHKKCCYCERKLHWKRESDVEHFRPKSSVKEHVSHKGYWWLAYEWDNYLFSCKICNSDYKSNRFPLLPGGKRMVAKGDGDLTAEKPVLIHPIDEDPESFIRFEWKESKGILVKAVGTDGDNRGDCTVNRLTGINDPLMMERRAELIHSLKAISTLYELARLKEKPDLVDKCAEMIKQATMANLEFAGFRRAFFRARNLSEHISTTSNEEDRV